MKDKDETKEQLVNELVEIRQRITELEALETERKRTEEELRQSAQLNELLLDSLPHPAMLIRRDRIVLAANRIAREVGAKVGDYCWRGFGQSEYIPEDDKRYINEHGGAIPPGGTKCTFCLADEAFEANKPINNPEVELFGRLWDTWWVPIDDDTYLHYAIDITERKRAEEALRNALKESRQRQAEISALLEGSRAVLENREFEDAARVIFDSCKNLIGATAGYVALLTKDGTENEVLFLEPGGLSCTVDPNLPMPIRGLREKAYRTGKTVYHNDFAKSEWVKYLPEGHVGLDNVLFAPLVLEGKTIGLLGLANKPGGFTENDARMATAFGELAAIALLNSRMLESLENSEERLRSVVQTASDAIISIDSRGDVVFWNDATETMFGYSADEIVGKPVVSIMPERFRNAHRNGLERVVSTGQSSIIGKTVEMAGLRKDGSEFPLELSLATWKTREGIFFTSVIRDITARKWAEEQLQRYAAELEQSNEELKTFAYIVSHDLRTPLLNIKGFSDELDYALKEMDSTLNACLLHIGEKERAKITTLLQKDVPEAFGFIDSSISKMDHLLNAILKLSRLGRRELEPEPINMKALVQFTLESLAHQLEQRSVRVTVGALPEVVADRVSMEQIMGNILDNAVKYLEPGRSGEIEITAECSPEETIFHIRDNGRGIAKEDIPKIFDLFGRAGKQDVPGEGMGLTYARTLIRRHGGRLWCESEPGVGTTFSFTISRKQS